MFAPTDRDTLEARERSARLWATEAPTRVSQDLSDLLAAHARFVAVAEQLAGTTRDAQRRAVVYFSIFEDSAGNFMFPMIASHGSLWGVRHTVRLDRWLSRLEVLSPTTVARWRGALDAIRDINRRVFIEIYSTFYFTRFYGADPRADQVIRPEILALYNEVHHAVSVGKLLPLSDRRRIYYQVFVHEQHDIVDPGIQQAIALCPSWIVSVFQRVRPRFAYFPDGCHLSFDDFTSVDQRNREGLRAMDWAEQVGPERVLAAMSEY